MDIARYIALEGPIGVGKTSLTKLLAEELDGTTLLEEVDTNPFLPKFYKDVKKFAFQTQLFFLLEPLSAAKGDNPGRPLYQGNSVGLYLC